MYCRIVKPVGCLLISIASNLAGSCVVTPSGRQLSTVARTWMGSLVGRSVLVAALLAPTALAGENDVSSVKQECATAYEKTQRARKAGQLLAARDAARKCSNDRCPAVLRSDCVEWMGEIESAIPSVAFRLIDAEGAAVESFEVALDDESYSAFDGRARSVDPGPHRVRFRVVDGQEVEADFTAVEGGAATVIKGELPPVVQDEPSGRGIPTASWVLGGVGVAGLGLFTGFAIDGKSKENSLANTCSPNCPPDAGDAAKQSYLIADVSLAVGLAALGAAVVVWAVQPGGKSNAGESALALELRPRWGGGHLGLRGRF